MSKYGKYICVVAMLATTISIQAQTTIEFWHAMGGNSGDTLQTLVDRFNDSQSEYTVKAVFKGGYAETMNAAIAAFRAKKSPAIVQVFDVGTATMMGSDRAIYPVYKLFKDMNEPYDTSDILPAVAGYYSKDSNLYALPMNSSTAVMFYNKDAFNKMGLDAPPATWEELEALFPKIKAQGFEYAFDNAWPTWMFIEQFGAWHNRPLGTLDNGMNGVNTKMIFDKDPAFITMLEKLAQWSKEGYYFYSGRTHTGAKAPFVSQQLPIMFESSAGYSGIKDVVNFELGIAPLPYWKSVTKRPQNTIVGGASLWVMRGKNDDEYKGTAKFLKFLVQPDSQTYWHKATGYIPVSQKAYADIKNSGYYTENPNLEVAILELNHAPPTSNSRGLRFGFMTKIREVMAENMERAINGKLSAQKALKNMVKASNKELKRFAKTQKSKQ